MGAWVNLVGYQLAWLGVVTFASRGQPWLSVAVAAGFAVAQWALSRQQGADARLVACAVGLGIVLDGGLAGSGLVQYASPQPALLAPAWILALWAAFAMTLNHSMAFLRGRPLLAASFGAIGGPLAYAGASRGFDALAFAEPAWPAVLVLAGGWALALCLLATLAGRWHAGARVSAAVGAVR